MLVKLLEINQIGKEHAGIIDVPEQFWPASGQYLSCQRVGDSVESLPHQLFPVMGEKNVLSMGAIPETWQPGDQLLITQPQGRGFKLPIEARRIALFSYRVSPGKILSLLNEALALGAAVSLFCDAVSPTEIMNHLPAAVEVSPMASLLENLDWPDFLAVDLMREDLPEFSALFEQAKVSFDGQVLVRTPMPCRGIGECGVCAVRTTKGWRLACVDGPVFPLMEVLHVAQ
jgi:dihydroorotate dehydrogenase electron transfer subunit